MCHHAADYPTISRAAGALNGFWNIYQKLVEAADTLPLDAFVTELLQITGYKKMLENLGDEGESRLENIGQLISSVKTYADQKGPEASLSGFLEEAALISDLDSYDQETDVVVLMTMHSAKGLEFDYVFIVGMEEGVFPSELSRFSEEDMEEERRLCYVGITRARKELYLSCSQSRMIFGQTRRNRPSRFLEEIDATLLDEKASPMAAQRSFGFGSFGGASAGTSPRGSVTGWPPGAGGWNRSASAGSAAPARAAGFGPTVGVAPQPRPATGKKPVFKPGDKVEHKVFGRGVVLKATPAAGDTIVEIQFERAGIKKTMANYAPLTLVEG